MWGDRDDVQYLAHYFLYENPLKLRSSTLSFGGLDGNGSIPATRSMRQAAPGLPIGVNEIEYLKLACPSLGANAFGERYSHLALSGSRYQGDAVPADYRQASQGFMLHRSRLSDYGQKNL